MLMIINDYYYATQLRYNNSFNSKTRKKGNNPRKTYDKHLNLCLFFDYLECRYPSW